MDKIFRKVRDIIERMKYLCVVIAYKSGWLSFVEPAIIEQYLTIQKYLLKEKIYLSIEFSGLKMTNVNKNQLIPIIKKFISSPSPTIKRQKNRERQQTISFPKPKSAVLIPSYSSSQTAIQVFGVSTTASAYIVRHLTQYMTEMVTAGITGIIVEIETTKMLIRLEKKSARVNNAIRVRQELALKINRALDQIENHPEIRPEIKKIVIQELKDDLDDIFKEIRRELTQDRL